MAVKKDLSPKKIKADAISSDLDAPIRPVRKTKTVTKKRTAPVAKVKIAPQPKIRLSRVSANLGLAKGAGVVNLRNRQLRHNAPSRSYYANDIYDEDMDRGEQAAEDDILGSEPIESLGELLEEDERLSYADPVASATVKQKKIRPEPERTEGSHFGVYKKLAIGFVVLALVVAAAVAYFLLVKVKVSVTLKNEAVAGELPFTVYDKGDDYTLPASSVKGLVKKIDLEKSQSFTVSGSEVIGEEVSGKMTLYNKYIKNQPLVATTRLLSASGLLFRLKNSVEVPAGGQIEVDVYADKPTPDMTVGQERFTLPGLWEGLRDKIYAESQAGAVTYQKKMKRVVKQEDIDNALKTIKTSLIDQAKTDVTNTYGDFDQQLYQVDEASLTTEVDGKLGEERDSITVKIKGAVVAVAFNSQDALTLIKNQAVASLPVNKELLGLQDKEVSYNLEKADVDNKIAEVKANYIGQAVVTALDELIDKNKLVNLSADQLGNYLQSIPEVAAYNLTFYPSFIRKAPGLVDRIELELKK
jgi:hypothetical protein